MTRTELLERAASLRSQRTPFVFATVVRAERPTSAKVGDSALVLPDGTIDGFVGGSCAESTVRLQGLRLLESGRSTLLRITPTPEAQARSGEGLVTVENPCLSGGSLEIFLEAMLPPPLVYVLGETPVARAIADLGRVLEYDIRAIDDRTVLAPDATAVVVASHGRDEEDVLTDAIEAGVGYIALVASRRRGASVLAELNVPADRVHTPAGLDIGARTAPEVALSILAEIISLRPRTIPITVVQPETAVDPVCGMDVAITEQALHTEYAGRTWYFCAPGCLKAFTAAPDQYPDRTPGGSRDERSPASL